MCLLIVCIPVKKKKGGSALTALPFFTLCLLHTIVSCKEFLLFGYVLHILCVALY